MGYTTAFQGAINIEPALNQQEIEYLTKFADTRRMLRTKGPYFVEGTGFKGQNSDDDVLDHNRPDPSQPGLWCHWVPSADGKHIEWDGGEKFYDSPEWMIYIIDHFLRPGCRAKHELPFLQANHVCNGVIKAQGEEVDDQWKLIVDRNVVSVKDLE